MANTKRIKLVNKTAVQIYPAYFWDYKVWNTRKDNFAHDER